MTKAQLYVANEERIHIPYFYFQPRLHVKQASFPPLEIETPENGILFYRDLCFTEEYLFPIVLRQHSALIWWIYYSCI